MKVTSPAQVKQLQVYYTNADQLVNKRDDLAMQIAGSEPDIMMLTEVIPKAQVLPIPLALLSIPGYSLYVNFDHMQENLGRSGRRGVCIYVRDDLPCAEVSLHTSEVVE